MTNFGIDNPEEYLAPWQINNYQGTPEETDAYYQAFIEPRANSKEDKDKDETPVSDKPKK